MRIFSVVLLLQNYFCISLSNVSSLTNVVFEVLTVVSMEVIVSCDVTPCSRVEVYRHFGGIYSLNLLLAWLNSEPLNGGNTFLGNFGDLILDHTALQPRI
jgi:hypothetical protein